MNPNAPPFCPRPRDQYTSPSPVQLHPFEHSQHQQQQPCPDYMGQQPQSLYHHPHHQSMMPGQMYAAYDPQHSQPSYMMAPTHGMPMAMSAGVMMASGGPTQPHHMGVMTSAGAMTGSPSVVSTLPPLQHTSIMPDCGGAGDDSLVNGQQQQGLPLSDHLLHRLYNHANCAAIVEVQIGLEKLVVDGYDFELWASAIRDRLTRPDINHEDMMLAVDLLIEMAVYTDNCQYNLSRLCQFLDQYIRNFAMGSLVPQLNEFANNHMEDYDYVAAEHRQNFLLFVAELYDKIEINGMRLTQLSSIVLNQVTILLHSDLTDVSVKAVVKIMKLIGRFLESDQGATPVDSVFGLLDDVCNSAGELSDVKGHVLALHQLREDKWGISTANETLVTSTTLNGVGPAGSSAMLIFGPDGKPLSEEEYAFLEESSAPFGGSNSPNESYVDDAFDEEGILRDLDDYEKFLEATAIRAAEKALEKLSFEEEDLESIISGASGSAAAGGDMIRTQATTSQSLRRPQQYPPAPAATTRRNDFDKPTSLMIVQKVRRN